MGSSRKFETSLLYALDPDHVSSKELGEHMIKCTLEALEKIIN